MTTDEDKNKPAPQIFDKGNKNHLGDAFRSKKRKKIIVLLDEVYRILYPPRRKKSESEEGDK